MVSNTQYSESSIEFECSHEDWEVRQLGYQKIFEIFLKIEDKNSNKWDSFIRIMKEFLTNENKSSCQLKGLMALLVFVKKCNKAGKIAKEVIVGIINNFLGIQETCVVMLANDVIWSYLDHIEVDIIKKELTDAISHLENATKVSNCLSLMGKIVKQYGINSNDLKKLVLKVIPLTQNGNKEIQREAIELQKGLLIWATPEILETMGKLKKSVHVTNNGMRDIKDEPVTEISRARETKLCHREPEHVRENREIGEACNPQTIYEYRHFQRTEVYNASISKMDKFLIENTSLIINESSGLVQSLSTVKNNIILDNNIPSYIDNPLILLERFKKEFYMKEKGFSTWSGLAQAVRSIILELMDKNNFSSWIDKVMYYVNKNLSLDISCTSVKCLTMCANILKNNFEPFIPQSMPILFGKFKEKQLQLTRYVRECIDSMFECSDLGKLQGILNIINNKYRHPRVKYEMNLFLVRCFSKSKTGLKLDNIETCYKILITDLDNQHFNIRGSAVQALGTAMRYADRKTMLPYLMHEGIKEFMLTKIEKYAESMEKSEKETMLRDSLRGESYHDLTKLYDNNNGVKKEKNFFSGQISKEDLENSMTSLDAGSLESNIDSSESEEYTELSSSDDESNGEISLGYSENGTKDPQKAFVEDGDEEQLDNAQVQTTEDIPPDEPSFYKYEGAGDSNGFYIRKNVEENQMSKNINCPNYCEKDMYTPLLDYPQWKCSILENREYSSEEYDQVSNATAIRFKQKRVPRSTGNEVWDQLIRNLLRKYDFDLGTVPEDMRHCEEKAQGGNKTEISLPDSLIQSLTDKDFNKRRMSLERIQLMVNRSIKPIDGCSPSLKKASKAIAERTSDCGLEISLSAICLIESLIISMGADSEHYTDTLLPAVLKGLGDPRPGVYQAILHCIKVWGETCGLEKLLQPSIVLEIDRLGSPAERFQLWKWLGVTLQDLDVGSVSKQTLLDCLDSFYRYLASMSNDVNQNLLAPIRGFTHHLHPQKIVEICKKDMKLQKYIRNFIESNNTSP